MFATFDEKHTIEELMDLLEQNHIESIQVRKQIRELEALPKEGQERPSLLDAETKVYDSQSTMESSEEDDMAPYVQEYRKIRGEDIDSLEMMQVLKGSTDCKN
ncbi:MAG: hypothetical protein J6X28_00635 [Bacilli bacterium]|nr:hypothetical protein [Bacilli bacterium]